MYAWTKQVRVSGKHDRQGQVMRLGCCGTFEDVPTLKSAGFDFVEVNVQQVLRGEEPDNVWEAGAPDPGNAALPIEVANCLVPGSMPLVGPGRDMAALETYMRRVTERARRLGIGMLVFGSGAARRRPEDVPEEEAMRQIVTFTRMAAEVCAAHDITLAVEHLCRKECNTINTLSELKALIDQAGHDHAGALVDSYHYGVEALQLQDILDLGGCIKHVHVAEPVGRCQPGGNAAVAESDDAFDFVAMFRALHEVGYEGPVSIEAVWSGELLEAGPACVKLLRDAWEQAKAG